MFRFLLRRLFLAVPVFFAVIFITFVLIHFVPGGPFDTEKEFSSEIRQKLYEKYNLDKPLLVQYGYYVKNLLKGDLGPSYKYTNWDVSELVKSKAVVSFELGAYSMIFALIVGILVGICGAYFKGSWVDIFCNFFSTIGICLPAFVVGPLLVYLFGVKLRWVGVASWDSWAEKILPTITVGILYASYVARLTKSGMCDVLQKQYITAARARGISEKKIFFVYALKNGLLPVVAYIGPAFAGIISGAIITETVFQIPGLGRLFIQAIGNRDDMLILGIVNFYCLAVIVCNTLSDCLQIWLNPRLNLS